MVPWLLPLSLSNLPPHFFFWKKASPYLMKSLSSFPGTRKINLINWWTYWSWGWELDKVCVLGVCSLKERQIGLNGAEGCTSMCICSVMSNPMDCSPSGSSVHGVLQARVLEGVAISFSRRSSWSRDRTHVSCIFCIGRWILYHCTTWEACSGMHQSVKSQQRLLGAFPKHSGVRGTSWRLIFCYELHLFSLSLFPHR